MKKEKLFSLAVSIALLLTLLLPEKGNCQSDKDRQEAALFVYNCGFGGITAGLGAVINKKKNEHTLPTFWRGFKYGALGGLFTYGGKRIDGLITKYSSYPYKCASDNRSSDAPLLWAWPAKIVHSVGSSIIENAAANKTNVFQDYNMPIGFINLSVSIKRKVVVTPQLMPASFITFLGALSNIVTLNNVACIHEKNTFKLKESLLLGTPYFSVESTLTNQNLVYDEYSRHTGFNALGNILADNTYDNTTDASYIEAHEYIHSLQFREYYVFNQYLSKSYNKLFNQNNKTVQLINKYVYADIPYFGIFYIPFFNHYPHYYKNPYEMEAEHFATNSYIRP